MEQQDYLQRQIDRLARSLGIFLCQLLGHINKRKITEGIEMTDQFLKTELDFNIDEFVKIPAAVVLTYLQEKSFNNVSFLKFADIILLVADELENLQPGNAKSRNIYEKCMRIYEYLNNTDPNYSLERHFKIAKIKKVLQVSP